MDYDLPLYSTVGYYSVLTRSTRSVIQTTSLEALTQQSHRLWFVLGIRFTRFIGGDF